MSFIPTANVCRVAIEGRFDQQPVVNTLWFQAAVPFTTTTIQQLLDTLKYDYETYLLPSLSSTFAYVQYQGWAQDSDAAPTNTVMATANNVGGDNTTTALPANAAVCTSFYTANRGRSSRGRCYIGGLSQAWLSGVKGISAGKITVVDALYNHIKIDCNNNGFAWVVVSHYHDKNPRASGLAQIVLTWATNAYMDTMRKRMA